jgi:hypothetical protein
MWLSDRLRRRLSEHPGTRMPLKHPPLAVPGEELKDKLDCAIFGLVWRSMLVLLCPPVCIFLWAQASWERPGRCGSRSCRSTSVDHHCYRADFPV